MSSAVVEDKKYDEGVYHYKKPILDPDIDFSIGSRLFIGDSYYGTIAKESEMFYYILTFYDELVEYQKTSIEDKVANKLLRLVD
ncbi:hypothetical protein [Clostridium estertheticum]|uniref:hypothetical protein n=1 Tax=Clostridium estertheticum TaxID=238834 RepID=UPI001C0A95E5|nr:hypothetical protein [Clostridium estertheticum]MBU3186514.1 hypothetical protein [Clostridium estertheticum]